ncbi:YaiI/YqxD family protein [Hathewaya massiliensis]|uniref:YaiI/YqxD family protein n=1 Tax=Hathewaya massiliensis TaxID=1964382 RepID=UPI001159D4E7|nr:YaiI/YqxD family protein [Hathewaya massiliensis]
MRILVDADACPGRDIIEKVARENSLDLMFYCSLDSIVTISYGEVIYVDSGFQAVDMKIANAVTSFDIVVTQDYGVATIALSKKAYAIDPKGYIYNDKNIDSMLMQRHISHKIRRGGGKHSNPKKRTAEDDNRLFKNLYKLINDYKK